MTIAIIAVVILLAIIAYFIVSNCKAKKKEAEAKKAHPSNTPVQTFIDTKPTFTQVQGTKNVHLVDTTRRRNTIANVVPKKAPLTSAEIEEQKATDRRARIQRERELREEESYSYQRRRREQEEYDLLNKGTHPYNQTPDFVWGGFAVGGLITENTHNEDASSKQEEQPQENTSKPEEYTGIPSYGGSDDSSSSSSSSYDSGSSYSSSSDSSSSYSSSSDSSSSYDSGSSSSGGGDW